MQFEEFVVSGGPRERGESHGSQLAQRIHQTKAFYAEIFPWTEPAVLQRAEAYREAIAAYEPEYCEEVEGIAAGADIDPRWIYALNARTELLAAGPPADVDECTSMFFRPSSVLGQTWDWGQRMEDLSVVLRIEKPDGSSIRMVCEPGFLGKIGMNSAGLGACLNRLRFRERLQIGVPVHVALRAILDASSIEQAKERIEAMPGGKASNILVGATAGKCFNVEFAGERHLYVEPPGDVVRHTNHYLAEPDLDQPEADMTNSHCRWNTSAERVAGLADFHIDQMADVLSDRSASEPILRRYVPNEVVQHIGTICTILMDLPNRRLHVRRGNDPANPFVQYDV